MNKQPLSLKTTESVVKFWDGCLVIPVVFLKKGIDLVGDI